MSEIRVLNLCHKKSILVDIYGKSLLKNTINEYKMSEKIC